MTTIIVPHYDSHKSGATEHVEAIVDALRARSDEDIVIADPVSNHYESKDGKNLPVDLAEQLGGVKARYGKGRYLVVTGDYGGDPALMDANVADTFKRVLGPKTQVVLSSYTAETQTVLDAFARGSVDDLALPAHAVDPAVIRGTPAESVLAGQEDRIIEMTAVPHRLTQESLAAKHAQWDQAAADGKVAFLPKPDSAREFVGVVMPGDVEDAQGRPKLFKEADAIKLADAIADQVKASPAPIVMISNGPRTGKYNEAMMDTPDYNPNHPAAQNGSRMDRLENNPVASAFVQRMREHFGEENVISGCIEKGKVPPQGFLAFYDALNRQTAAGGKASLFIDGVSTTMMAQAANVVDPAVRLITCDTEAKNKTHDAGVADLVASGHVEQLRLGADGYERIENARPRSQAPAFDAAAIVADCIVDMAKSPPKTQWGPYVTGRTGPANGHGASL
jgi:hypothetical protein